jgi:hypothetical protein
MNAKARQNNTGRIHGANPRYEIDIFSLSGPSHWWRDPYLAKLEGLFISIRGKVYVCRICTRRLPQTVSHECTPPYTTVEYKTKRSNDDDATPMYTPSSQHDLNTEKQKAQF